MRSIEIVEVADNSAVFEGVTGAVTETGVMESETIEKNGFSSKRNRSRVTILNFIVIAALFAAGLSGCGSEATKTNTELGNSELDETTFKAAFEKVPPASMPYEVKFVNVSTDRGVDYLWDFGDGQTSSEKEPIHTFKEIGIYCVTLTVTVISKDDEQISESISFTDKVIVNSVPPVDDASSEVIANFDVLFSSSCPNDVMFINTSKNVASFTWNFGDGYTSSQREPAHTFTEAGTYNVTLTVVGKDMSRTSITKPVVINE